MTATNHDDQLAEMYSTILNELTVHLALVFHVFIAVAVTVMVCGHRGLWPSWYRPVVCGPQSGTLSSFSLTTGRPSGL